jgi:hypothetical protein
MSNIINSQAYVKQGDKVYKVNGGAGSPIHTFNSVEEMNAANLADGSIACVPSEGDTIPTFDLAAMGLPALGNSVSTLSTDTTEIMSALDKGLVKFRVAMDGFGNIDFIAPVFCGMGMYQVIAHIYNQAIINIVLVISDGYIEARMA